MMCPVGIQERILDRRPLTERPAAPSLQGWVFPRLRRTDRDVLPTAMATASSGMHCGADTVGP